MSTAPPPPGFAYDDYKAGAIADALEATLTRALGGQVTAPEQLAGAEILAARIIGGTWLRRNPGAALTFGVQVAQAQLMAAGLPATVRLP